MFVHNSINYYKRKNIVRLLFAYKTIENFGQPDTISLRLRKRCNADEVIDRWTASHDSGCTVCLQDY